ncbi:exosome complex component MTR3 [Galendromus occidentalis]|uniref:Exosome complex component MTR3 n=1 Tax=Galendromus occidentalis TaxID=34638 RepID=A0AAJ6QXP1_9ACAR|nr:exosome complex component MTR3 [Galendromus occidentalis]
MNLGSDRKTRVAASVPYQRFMVRPREPEKEFCKRKDGRRDEELRPRIFESGLVSDASGSGYVEQGSTKVVAAVFGPREVTRRKEFSLKAQLRCVFTFEPFATPGGRQENISLLEQRYSSWLEESLKPVVQLRRYPKASIDIRVTCLENDGGVLAAALTACGIALATSGIETFDLVIGVNLRAHGDRVLMDPSHAEEDAAPSREGTYGNVTLGFMPVLCQITGLLQTGDSEPATLCQQISSLIKIAHGVKPLMEECLIDLGKLQEKLSEVQM